MLLFLFFFAADFFATVADAAVADVVDFLDAATEVAVAGFFDAGFFETGAAASSSSFAPNASGDSLDSSPSSSDILNADRLIGFLPDAVDAVAGFATDLGTGATTGATTDALGVTEALGGDLAFGIATVATDAALGGDLAFEEAATDFAGDLGFGRDGSGGGGRAVADGTGSDTGSDTGSTAIFVDTGGTETATPAVDAADATGASTVIAVGATVVVVVGSSVGGRTESGASGFTVVTGATAATRAATVVVAADADSEDPSATGDKTASGFFSRALRMSRALGRGFVADFTDFTEADADVVSEAASGAANRLATRDRGTWDSVAVAAAFDGATVAVTDGSTVATVATVADSETGFNRELTAFLLSTATRGLTGTTSHFAFKVSGNFATST